MPINATCSYDAESSAKYEDYYTMVDVNLKWKDEN